MSLRRFFRGQPRPDLSQVPEVLRLTVDECYDGWRLDVYLGEFLTWASRTQIQDRIDRALVRKNGQPVPAARKVRAGDIIEIDVPPPVEDPGALAGLELPVLAEDEWLVAIDKPPNLLVHPVGKRRFGSVINLLHARYRSDDPARDVIPLLAHRIDQETTGVLLVAKGKPARAAFYKLFEQQPVIKEYLALVEGHLQPPAGRIDLPIGSRRHEIHVTRGINHDDGLPAQSLYRVEQRLPGFDLVRVRLVSGRQHQVRLHMEALGHPLLGDLYYGVRRQLTIDDAAAIVAAAVVQPPPPLPDLPPADELFAAPEQLPLVDQVNASWRFRMTMIPPDGPDPWADDHEAELMADPEYQEASPPTRPVGFNPDPAVLIDRVALHAARLAFVHPLSDPPVEMDIRAPLPPDMSAVIAALGSASSR